MAMVVLLRAVIGVFLILPFLAGCGLKYSPYMNPAAEPLPAHKGEVAVSWGGLPETGTMTSTAGVELGAKYAFSDRLTLQARLWSEVDNLSDMNLDGYSFDAIYMLNDTTSPVRIGLMPKVTFLMNGRRVDAHAEYLGGIAWLPDFWVLQPYVGVGAGIGTYLEQSGDDPEDQEYWGVVVTGNAGAGWEFVKDLSLKLELATIFINDRYNNESSWYPVLPNFSLAYSF